MAVEAHHHLLHNTAGSSQKIAAGWEGGGGGCYDDAPAATTAAAACYVDGAGRQSDPQLMQQQQVYHQFHHQQLQESTCMGLTASESGVTFGGGARETPIIRKRKRADVPEQSQFLQVGVLQQQQQLLVDVDRLVLQHTAKMWAALSEHRRRHARQVAAAAEAALAKRLHAKDAEIERVGRLNWALEERVRSLFAEAQAWRDLAQSNEAAANALRGELQHALDKQQYRVGGGGAAVEEDDAASCCCGENDFEQEEDEVGTTGRGRRCAVCDKGAVEVLLLPCRHLCACAPCAAAATVCPACGCAKNGTVRVNFS